MKNLLLTLLFLTASISSFAQENSIEIRINGEVADFNYLWKAGVLVAFAIVILILVLRTFRGKPEV